MATDFWVSSHYKRWIVDRASLRQARSEDIQYVDDPEHLDFLAIYFANIITKLGKKLQLRQRVIATATVFFRRFYIKNAYCETDPFMVISACIYVAAKAEESPVHIKNVISESRSLFSQTYGVKNFPTDNSKLAEMEFYLVSDLECDLIVYHPYRTLLALCKTDSSNENPMTGEEGEEGEAEELGEVGGNNGSGVGIDEGHRYWGTGEGKLVLSKEALQIAWSIINDTYRSELCLIYPPHLIAIAALYLTFILHPPLEQTRSSASSTSNSSVAGSPQQEHKPQPRRSSRQATNNSTLASSLSTSSADPKWKSKPDATKNPDPITFLAQLNVSLPLVATIAQEIISLYTLWDQYKEDASPDAPSASALANSSSQKSKGITSRSSSSSDLGSGSHSKGGSSKGKGKSVGATSGGSAGIPISSLSSETSLSVGIGLGFPSSMDMMDDGTGGLAVASPTGTLARQNRSLTGSSPSVNLSAPPVTTAFLSQILFQMREARLLDLTLGGEGELLGLSPADATAAAVTDGGGGLAAMSIGHSGSSASSMVGGGGSGMQGMGSAGPQFAINKVLERAMSAYG